MKRLLSLALIIAMMFMMSANVYAETITNDGTVNGNQNQDVTITYTSNVSYTVTIPDSMTIGEEATISVSDVMIDIDQGLSITVSSTQYSGGWLLKDQSTKKTVGYTLKNENPGADLPNNGTVLYTTSGNDATATLYTDIKRAPLYTGTFTDTLTFSISIADRNVSSEEVTTLINQAAQLKSGMSETQKEIFSNELASLETMVSALQYAQSQADINSTYFEVFVAYNELYDLVNYSNA